MTNLSHRREFLRTATAAATLAAVQPATASANDTIRVACIGTGGRCRALLKALAKIPTARVVSLCDVYEPNIAATRPLVDTKADATGDYRRVLDRKDVDAVLIATPDHWHTPMTIAACEAGKDVYVEKPLTHKLSEGQAVIDAQNRNKRIVQVGTQQRSMPHIHKAMKIVKSGRLGQISRANLTWNRNTDRVKRGPQGVDANKLDWKAFLGNAPDQPFDEYRYRHWRWFWDFGNGIFADLMVHHLDIVNWFLDLSMPQSAVAVGSHVKSAGVWECPDTVQTLLTYPNGLQVHFAGTFSNARDGEMIEILGNDASLYIDRGRYELHPERGRGEYQELVLGTGKRGADFYDNPDGELLHLAHWLDCVRTRQTPNSPAEAGVLAAAAAHMANRAMREGIVAK